MFKIAGNELRFGVGVLLFLLFFAGAGWYASERLDEAFDDAYALETGWIQASLLLRGADEHARFSALGVRDIPLRGGEPRIAAARRALEHSFAEMDKLRKHIPRVQELAPLSHPMDEAVRRAHLLAGILDDLQNMSRDIAKKRDEVEEALESLREHAREILADERSFLERHMHEGASAADIAASAESLFALYELKDIVTDLDRAVGVLLSEGGAQEAEAARDVHEALRSSLRTTRMETFEHGRLERLDAMLERADIFWNLFDAFPRLLDLGRDLSGRGEAAGDALLDSLDELQRISGEESFRLAGNVTNETASLWRAARLSMQLALVCAVFTAILTFLFSREK